MTEAKKKYRRLTDERLAEIAKQYKTRRAFYDADPSAYVSASRRTIEVPNPENGPDKIEVSLLDHICAHMFTGRFKWTRKMIENAAQQFETRLAFAEGDKAAYSAATRWGILNEVCAHMPKYKSKKKPDTPASLAKRYKTVEGFAKYQPDAYEQARKDGILEEICAHMFEGAE